MDKLKFDSLTVKEWEHILTTEPHILPIYATSSFEFDDTQQSIEIFGGAKSGHTYSRYGNPTLEAVASKIALLESYDHGGSATGVLTNSGMSAIHITLFSLLKPGDTLITQPDIYGGTTEMIHQMVSQQGIQVVLDNCDDADRLEELFRKHSSARVLYLETPTNPALSCVDIKMATSVAHSYGAKVVVDNTFATPYLQQPLSLGADIVIHSTTKYLNGHGNSLGGVIISNDTELMKNSIWNTMKLTGANASPFDAFLTYQGLKTLALRMERHCKNANQIAHELEKNKHILKVNYPGLQSHNSHSIAKKQMRDFGGMMSIEIKGGLEKAIRFMDSLHLCKRVPTLGDVDTLVLHPASSSHVKVPKEIRIASGISDGLVRISVGIENGEDILNDILQALEA